MSPFLCSFHYREKEKPKHSTEKSGSPVTVVLVELYWAAWCETLTTDTCSYILYLKHSLGYLNVKTTTLDLLQYQQAGRKTEEAFSQDLSLGTVVNIPPCVQGDTGSPVRVWEEAAAAEKYYLHHRSSLGLSSHWQPHKACPETDDSATKTTQVSGRRPPGAEKQSHTKDLVDTAEKRDWK